MKKKILSILLALCLSLTLLPTGALAVGNEIFVGGQWINYDGGSNTYLKSDDSTGLEVGSNSDYTICYDPTTHTLTLNNAVFSAVKNADNAFGIAVSGVDITLELLGSNTINQCSDTVTAATGVLLTSNHKLTITGNGSLTVTASSAANSSTGIYVGTLEMNGTGAVTATGGTATNGESTGIKATIGIIANSGTLTGNGGTAVGTGAAAEHNYSYGIYAARNVLISNAAEVTGNGGIAGACSYGIMSGGVLDDGNLIGGNIAVSGTATVNGTGGGTEGTDGVDISIGIIASGDFTATGGTVTGLGGTASAEDTASGSAGILVSGDMTVSGGTVIGTGVEAAATGMITNPTDPTDTYGAYSTSAGVAVMGELRASAGSVTGNGGAASESYGINVHDGVFASGSGEITGSSSTATTTGTSEAVSSGVFAYGVISAGGSSVITGTSGDTETTNSEGFATSAGIFSEALQDGQGNAIGGITVEGSATVTGESGKAIASNSELSVGSMGVYARGVSIGGTYLGGGNIVVSGGALTGRPNSANGESSYESTGILARGTLSLTGGSTTGVGGKAVKSSAGIYSRHDITISGTSTVVSGTGGDVSSEDDQAPVYSDGILADSDFTVSGGTVTALGGGVKTGGSEGIYLDYHDGDLEISGGEITATGGTATGNGNSTGIVAAAAITGGTVKAAGGAVAQGGVSSAFDSDLDFGTVKWYKWRKTNTNPAVYTRSGITSLTLATEAPYDTYVEITTDDVYIKTQPQNRTFTVGSISGALTVEAAGTSADTTAYQWWECNDANKAGATNLSGALSNSFAVPTDLAVGTHYYYCVVTRGSIDTASDVAVVTVNPVPSGPSYDYFTITVKAGEGGSISPSSSVSIREGRDKTFTITPNTGYVISNVLVDGVSVGAVSEYTFENIQKRHTIEAVFAKPNMENFKLTGKYAGYSDVDESKWYGTKNEGAVRDATLLGLVEGYGDGKFGPADKLKISEAVKLACMIHSIYNCNGADLTQGEPWYDVYVDYAITNGIIKTGDFTDCTAVCTRAQAAYIFAHALPQVEFTVIKTLTPPDVAKTDKYGAEIYQLYAAGILCGTDETGTFLGTGAFTRAQAAAIATRMCLPGKR